jgi:regulator of chromosome condensation
MSSSKRSLSEDTTFTTTPLGTKRQKREVFHTTAPSQPLDIYVFGSGENGELGLGASPRHGRDPTKVKRPRLNDLLPAKTVGVVQIAVGALHCVALTRDNRILTWGINDNGALGRETGWDEVMRDADALEEEESDVDEDVLNPKESTPTALDPSLFGESLKTFVQVAASHNASFVLTDDGAVYGWGTFRVSLRSLLYFNSRDLLIFSG